MTAIYNEMMAGMITVNNIEITSGNITGIRKGEATILIRLRGQEEVYTTVEVSVEEDSETPVDKNDNSDMSKPSTETQDNPAQHVTLRDFSVEEKNVIVPAKGTSQLTIKYTPENATDRPTWTSADPKGADGNGHRLHNCHRYLGPAGCDNSGPGRILRCGTGPVLL